VYREPPKQINGKNFSKIYHRSDVTRLEILLEHGGIYLDYDVIVVNSLDPVRCYDATLGQLLYTPWAIKTWGFLGLYLPYFLMNFNTPSTNSSVRENVVSHSKKRKSHVFWILKKRKNT